MPHSQAIAAALAGLYPAEAVTFFSATPRSMTELWPEELEFTSGMVDKRRAEFTHGRYCARSAMKMLGVATAPIRKGPNREPLWPEGIIGSISHTEQAAAAVVAKSSELLAVGLDMEESAPLTAELGAMICLPQENRDQDGARAKILFSIKEAIYKCLYPLINEYVDFLEMEVSLDEQALTYTARPHAKRLDQELVARMQGRYLCHSEYIISSAWIR